MAAKSPISRRVGQAPILVSRLVKSLKSPKTMSTIPTMKLVMESVSIVSLVAVMVELVNVAFSSLSNIVVIIVVLIHVSFSKSVVTLVELNSDPLSSNIVVGSFVVHGVLPHSL